jgi:hypothetical protein
VGLFWSKNVCRISIVNRPIFLLSTGFEESRFYERLFSLPKRAKPRTAATPFRALRDWQHGTTSRKTLSLLVAGSAKGYLNYQRSKSKRPSTSKRLIEERLDALTAAILRQERHDLIQL